MYIDTGRDGYGAIDLSCLPKEQLNYYNHDHAIFYYNNIKYYVKRCKSVDKLYNGLIAEELAHDYGIKCSYSDIAFEDGSYYFISADMMSSKDRYITMNDFLKGLDDCYNNLNDIWNALVEIYRDEQIVFKLMKELIDIFLFDILIANVDRHNENYGIIQNGGEVSFGYLFDNENMLDSISIYEGGYSIGVDRDDYFVVENRGRNFLEKFLSVSDSYYLDYFKDKLSIISSENIVSVFSRIENKIGCPIHPYIKSKVLNKLNDNYQSYK